MLTYLIYLSVLAVVVGLILTVKATLKGPTYFLLAFRFFRKSHNFSNGHGFNILFFELTLPAVFVSLSSLFFGLVLWVLSISVSTAVKEGLGLMGLFGVCAVIAAALAGGVIILLRRFSRDYTQRLVARGKDIDQVMSKILTSR